MKTKKLLARLTESIPNEGRDTEAELDSVKKLLDKLKKRQKKLEEQLEGASGHEQKRLKNKIKVIKAQRKKGIERYEALRDKS